MTTPVRSERSEVIDANRQWASAETVRRTWLRRFLARKTPPKGAALWIAETIALADYPLRQAMTFGNQLGHELLGTVPAGDHAPTRGPDLTALVTSTLAGVSEARAEMVTLGLLLGAQEQATDRQQWRFRSRATVRYLRYLEALGYPLSEIEQRACGEASDAD